jgi:beta-lactamase regulating signal transducer with metallopeptidase domain
MNATQFLEFGASVSLQAAIVVTTTAALRRFGRIRARSECRLWHSAHVVILALTIGAATFPHVRLLPHTSIDPASAVATAESRGIAGQVLLVVWTVGVGVSTLSLVAGWISAAICLKRCRAIGPDELPCDSSECAQVFQKDTVSLRTGPHVAGPCCWQFHRPYILLPEAVLQLRPRELLFVLRHELAHLREGHPLQLFIQRVVEIVFWFHPFIWWSARQAALAREFACDEAVAASRFEIADYLRTLLAVVEQSQTMSDACGQTLNFGAGSSVIACRARRLVELARSPARTERRRIAACRIATLVLCGFACTAAWLPVDSLASSRSMWSPWPSWSAALATDLGIAARDYEMYDRRTQLYELREAARPPAPSSATN